MHFATKLTAPHGTKVLVRIFIADGSPMQDDLGRLIRAGLEKHRIHVRVTRDTCGLCLHSLRTAQL